MSQSRLVRSSGAGWAVVSCLFVARAAWAIEHPNVSESDRFRSCAQEVFGKSVLMNDHRLRPGDIRCPAPKEEIVRTVESWHHFVFENDHWVAPMALFGVDHPNAWFRRRLQIEETVEQLKDAGEIERSRLLTAKEVTQIQDAVKAEVRTPLVGVIREGFLTYTALVRLNLILDCHRFRKDRDSVVGIWGELAGYSRLLYGEKTARGFELLWDSPLIPARLPAIAYDDLDGDGVEEILVYSRFGDKYFQALSIFNTKGDELSRQDGDCPMDVGSRNTEEGTGCPIVALEDSFKVLRRPDGKKDIVVRVQGLGETSKTERYRLIGRRYVTHDHPSKVEALIAALRDPDARTRSAAASQLGDLGAKAAPAVAALAKTLADQDEEVGIAAAEALGKLGPMAAAAVPALTNAASAKHDGYLRAAAQEALKKISGAQ